MRMEDCQLLFTTRTRQQNMRRRISAFLALALILSIVLPVFGYAPASAAKKEDKEKETELLVEQTINVVLYTEGNQPEKVTVPSFLGCAAYEANSVALQAGLNVSYSGAVSSGGVAVAQSIAEGAEVARGTVVSVTFAANTSDGNSD